MSKSIRERFSVSYERGAAASFLTLKTDLPEKIIYYQVEMVACNRIPHILPFDVRRENNETCLRYNITSMLPLTQFLKRKISRNEFLGIFADVTKAILDSRNYFLCDKNIILDIDYVYINPGSGEVAVVYIPAEFDVDVGNEFRQFVMNVIINAADIDEGSGDNFIQRILGYAKSDTFNMVDFNKLVMDLLAGNIPLQNSMAGKTIQDDNWNRQHIRNNRAITEGRTEGKGKKQDLSNDKENKRRKRLLSSEQTERKKFWDDIISDIDIPEDDLKSISKENLKDNQKERLKGNPDFNLAGGQKDNTKKGSTKNNLKDNKKNNLKGDPKHNQDCEEKDVRSFRISKNVLLAIAVQVILVAVFIATKDHLGSLSGDTSVTYGAAILIMIAIDVLIFKKLFFKDGVIISVRDEEAQEAQEEKETLLEYENYLYEDISLNAVRRSISQYEPNRGGGQWGIADEPMISGLQSNDTVVLGVHDAKCPILKGTGSCAGEVILIVKPEFTLGRLESQVDYVIRNSAVGKVHAQIITRESSYFIKDLNSKNGTCINDVKIDSNEEYRIENNDKITLANNEYIFITP
ncbi:MAG TPA: FHA domain-containing protein [Clostridiaceae bacterium]|nr:FHA domain-containing protein [Clostridiaceae bacterium]